MTTPPRRSSLWGRSFLSGGCLRRWGVERALLGVLARRTQLRPQPRPASHQGGFPVAALPKIIVGLRIALGIAWLVVVAAEMIAVDSGLGYLVIDSRNSGVPKRLRFGGGGHAP